MFGAEPLSRPSAPREDAPPRELSFGRSPIAGASLPGAVLLLAIAVFPAALLVRWNAIDRFPGRLLEPSDAKEYVASAQAIRQTGRFFLQVGPREFPPRYPPGWPMLLAGALELGLPPERTPEIAAAFDSVHALLIAVATAFFCRWLRGAAADVSFLPSDLLAGMVAGWGWAFTPLAVNLSVFALSDAAVAAVVDAMFLSVLAGMWRRSRWWVAGSVFFTGGCLLGLALAMRPVVLALVAGPLVLLAIAHALNVSRRLFVLSLTSFLAGVAIPVACTAVLMSRSGWGAWNWSHYAFWVREFSDLAAVFRWRHLTEGFADVRIIDPVTGEAFSHLRLALHLFLGIPITAWLPGLGPVWPSLAWLLGGALAFERALRSGDSERRLGLLVIGAFVTWILGHVLLFGTYFFPGTRFYLPPLVLAWVLLGGVAGQLGHHAGPVWRAVALATLALTAISVVSELEPSLAHPSVPSAELNERDVRAPVRAWLMATDDERPGLPVPFDPVRAQALGLLSPAVLSKISGWGTLPPTEHTTALRDRGLLE